MKIAKVEVTTAKDSRIEHTMRYYLNRYKKQGMSDIVATLLALGNISDGWKHIETYGTSIIYGCDFKDEKVIVLYKKDTNELSWVVVTGYRIIWE